ncbi:hypothetical protein Vadar_025777 [Vaccinium darrowii]|uniref:Uncharacterized protein n=1 Tax=Vaccinium darrowii TaxID=229202 RepID=A0ACB7ZMZ0_9ERIC|nr:hypothetical protein Vadar_025777 [Vaccinium darrowii]
MKMMREVTPLKRTRKVTVKPLVRNDNVTQPTMNLEEFWGMCYATYFVECEAEGESLPDFLKCFNNEALLVDKIDNKVPLNGLIGKQAKDKPQHPQDNHEEKKNDEEEAPRQPIDEIRVISRRYASGGTVVVANYETIRVLIDNGSSADILFVVVFHPMGNPTKKLQFVQSPLVGFSGEKVQTLGAIDLPDTMGTSLQQVVKLI